MGRMDAETQRLKQDLDRTANWKRWGPYLSERQWGTVREDYSADGDGWDYFPHDHARSRAYRWGEDGLLGICDREGRLCLALALWNERDSILKERLFGLTNPQGNHGEDVKEEYFYLDATPTASYLRGLYKYPHAAFPYERLVSENAQRTRAEPEFELADTGVFNEARYCDVQVEYAKAGPDDILIRLTLANRGPEPVPLHVLPTLWFRNTWVWQCTHEGCWPKPSLHARSPSAVETNHPALEPFLWDVGPGPDGVLPELLFTDNETNNERLYRGENPSPYVKDTFHEAIVHGRADAVNPKQVGTKVAAHYRLQLPAGREVTLHLRLRRAESATGEPWADFAATFAQRQREADDFYAWHFPGITDPEQRRLARLASAGLLWSKQFYHYVVPAWLHGDPGQPTPPGSRLTGRNHLWPHFYARNVISMPDKWEYPWFAAWDLAFHTLPLAQLDPAFAQEQLLLLTREWYMHPSGHLPAYEYDFSDANPPVHAWATWRVYKIAAARGHRDRNFLKRVFHKLLLNFTWWVNRKDVHGRNLFSGGFLGLDNIGVFDRNSPLPGGASLEQADGTAWMAFYCTTLLAIALELADHDPAYEDVASKFFEHFIAIADAMNSLGGCGLWNEEDGFYYDQIALDGQPPMPLKVRSLVGVIPLLAVEVMSHDVLEARPHFAKRALWLLHHRRDLARYVSYMHRSQCERFRMLALPSRDRLVRVLQRLLDENEFLSPYGIRSLSRYHRDHPFELPYDGVAHSVRYVPGDSDSGMFGGNSNWRGPVWFPINYLLVEALERYDRFYGDTLKVECPTGSGHMMTLGQVARELATRLTRLFLVDGNGRRPSHGPPPGLENDPHWRDLVLFHEYFDGDTGRGLGASHQTGWTALVMRLLGENASPIFRPVHRPS
jgi:hypothetical protein